MEKCLVPNCNRRPFIRGCCHACDQAFRRAISRGEITDAELVDAGLRYAAHAQFVKSCPATDAVRSLNKENKCNH